jgi:hypothetical protein
MKCFGLMLLALNFSLASAMIAATEDETTFSSGAARVNLLELYTSEGCSSCPPAESWLSRFKDDPRLWRQAVPVAFHVDYWDRLGWKDPFASGAHTERQRRYASRWGNNSVYTPGFVLNGREWSQGGGDALATAAFAGKKEAGGVLSVVLQKDGKTAFVTYRPAARSGGARDIQLALLGCGLRKAVGAGENRGRTLTHDFVALGIERQPLKSSGNGEEFRATLTLPDAPSATQSSNARLALAAWVTASGELEPEQAVGGWLPGRYSDFQSD